jgi:mono/diheme cytochrome c family protein
MKCKFVVNAMALMVMSATSWAANDGATLYKQKCAGCHGANGEGKPAIKAPPLEENDAGGEPRLSTLRRARQQVRRRPTIRVFQE